MGMAGRQSGQGEDFADALCRELREETGLDVELVAFAGAFQFSMPSREVVLLCMEVQMTGGKVRLSEEHDEFAWVALGDLHQCELPDPHRPFMLEYAARKLRVD
jgi:8-oxo-dGTP diphosphatase